MNFLEKPENSMLNLLLEGVPKVMLFGFCKQFLKQNETSREDLGRSLWTILEGPFAQPSGLARNLSEGLLPNPRV